MFIYTKFSVRHLVLDEADRLLEEGFLEQTREIVSSCSHPDIQKAVFSATMPAGVEAIAKDILSDPIRVVVGLKWVMSFSHFALLHTNDTPPRSQRRSVVARPPNLNIRRNRIRETNDSPSAPRLLSSTSSPRVRSVPRARSGVAPRIDIRWCFGRRPSFRHDAKTKG